MKRYLLTSGKFPTAVTQSPVGEEVPALNSAQGSPGGSGPPPRCLSPLGAHSAQSLKLRVENQAMLEQGRALEIIHASVPFYRWEQ